MVHLQASFVLVLLHYLGSLKKEKNMDFKTSSYKVSIIGLGYVGLPLAVEFAKKYKTIGFDIDSRRIQELNSLFDNTNEVDESVLKKMVNSNAIIFSSEFSLPLAGLVLFSFMNDLTFSKDSCHRSSFQLTSTSNIP